MTFICNERVENKIFLFYFDQRSSAQVNTLLSIHLAMLCYSSSHKLIGHNHTICTLGVRSRSRLLTFVAVLNILEMGFPLSRGTVVQLYILTGQPLCEHVTRTPQGEICITHAPRVTITAPPSGRTCTVVPLMYSVVGCNLALGTGMANI